MGNASSSWDRRRDPKMAFSSLLDQELSDVARLLPSRDRLGRVLHAESADSAGVEENASASLAFSIMAVGTWYLDYETQCQMSRWMEEKAVILKGCIFLKVAAAIMSAFCLPGAPPMKCGRKSAFPYLVARAETVFSFDRAAPAAGQGDG